MQQAHFLGVLDAVIFERGVADVVESELVHLGEFVKVVGERVLSEGFHSDWGTLVELLGFGEPPQEA